MISSTYHLQGGGYGNNSQDDEDSYQCSFEVINSQQQYRSSRLTPKPIVQGPQTAIIVGPTGEEIYTDEFGRVKVQFHWDRYGKNDENSSCWTRVSYSWAGKKWGSISLPRIGQEVIISFVEGDPDRPIITGRVYNADNMPPYELPANATQSGVKSRSSKGGSIDNFNEIRFEDKKGSEEIYIHAELNQKNIVENDTTTNIGNDAVINIVNDRSITIEGNHTENVTHDHKETIGGDQIINITCDQKSVIKGDHIEDIENDHKETIGGDQIINITGDQNNTIIGNRNTNITGSDKTEVEGNQDWLFIGNKAEVHIGEKTSNTIGAAHDSFVGAKLTTNLSTEINITKGLKSDICEATSIDKTKIGKCIAEISYSIDSPDIFITGGSMIFLKVGGGSLKITDGLIEIKGDVDITGNVSISKNMVATKNVIGKNIESK